MKTDKLLHLLQQKKFMRSGGALPLPKAQLGLAQAIKVSDKNDPRLKAYNDSNLLYNVSKRREMQFNKDPFDSRLNEYGKEVDGLAKRLKMNPIAYRQGWDSSNFTEFPFNSPDAEYYLQSDEPYIAKYKKPVQPYVYDPTISLMPKKGINPINFITPDPVKVKNAKTSNNWYMDTRGEWTNIPLQQYIHGANKFQEGGQDYTSDSEWVTPSNVDKKQTGGLAKAQKGITNPLMLGTTFATGAIEPSASPLDLIGVGSLAGLARGVLRMVPRMNKSFAEESEKGWFQAAANVSENDLARQFRELVSKINEPSKQQGGATYKVKIKKSK